MRLNIDDPHHIFHAVELTHLLHGIEHLFVYGKNQIRLTFRKVHEDFIEFKFATNLDEEAEVCLSRDTHEYFMYAPFCEKANVIDFIFISREMFLKETSIERKDF
jgi:hypothetical protein